MKRIQLTILSLMLAAVSGSAQVLTPKPLKVGDPMPDVTIKRLFNYPKSSVQLKDLKGKAVILDFCNTSCSVCTENMPHLMELKKQFRGKLEVIRIIREPEQKLKALYGRSDIAANSKLPVAVSDTIFSMLFPIKLQHQAWLDARGVVRAITDYRNATPENIRALVDDGNVQVAPFAYLESFDQAKPLFDGNGIDLKQHLRQYSMVTGYVNEIHALIGFSVEEDTGTIYRMAFYNTPILSLLKQAYGGFDENKFGTPSDYRRVILEVKDSTRFVAPRNKSQVVPWRWQNTWCYEVQVEPKNASRIPYLMQADLCRYFDLDVAVEVRKVTGLALVRHGREFKLKTSGELPISIYNRVTNQYHGTNQTTAKLAKTLSYNFPFLVADETNVAENIDYVIPKTNDLEKLRPILRGYGLDLVKKEIEIEMLVVRDKK